MAINDKGNYQDLADAIVLEAVENYRMVIKCLIMSPGDKRLIAEREEIEGFFRGSWFSTLTDINGEKLIVPNRIAIAPAIWYNNLKLLTLILFHVQ